MSKSLGRNRFDTDGLPVVRPLPPLLRQLAGGGSSENGLAEALDNG